MVDETSAVFGDGSPIFDATDFPPLRRMKPLPKRRRIIDPIAAEADLHSAADNSPSTDPTVQLASTLSTSMALQSYYMPIFGNVQDMFKEDLDTRHVDPVDFQSRSNDDGYRDRREEDGQDDGDYSDHLQHAGNTKKRKVPLNASSRLDEDKSGHSTDDEAVDHRAVPVDGTGGRFEAFAADTVRPASPPAVVWRKGRLSRATAAGLQHKEVLKSRKKQLAAVLGALSHGDTLALDQALSSSYPFTKGTQPLVPGEADGNSVRIRLSRRPSRQKARAAKLLVRSAKAAPLRNGRENLPIGRATFDFECYSATSERLRATKEEVAYLHSRFEAELSRQAEKVAEVARQAELAVSRLQKSRRSDRSQQRKLTNGGVAGATTGDANLAGADRNLAASKGKSKKKKRSTLANASNPHHLRNYVPSRLPRSHPGPLPAGQTAINAQNLLNPHPLRFLSAELPPRAKKGVQPAAPSLTSLTNPEEEWICAFCEYNLFYGEEHSYRRAIRSRKKILSRRRRAMERAAVAAAGGKRGVAPSDRSDSVDDDLAESLDVTSNDILPASKLAKVKVEQDRDRDKERGTY